MKTSKYSIGDWFYDNDMHGRKYFWKITGVCLRNGSTVYDVAFMSDTNKSLEFRHWGDLGGVPEKDLRPVTGAIDKIRCLLSDAQAKYRIAKTKMDNCKNDVNTLLRTKEILESG